MNSNYLQINIRKKIIKMALASKEGHIASSFSIVEILIAIYRYMETLSQESKFSTHTILSKGHAVFALYGIMNEVQLLSDQDLDKVCQYGSFLIGHVPARPDKNFFLGTGSLGQGFPIALGRAYINSLNGESIPQFVIIGDGELNEGSCWEALLLMQKFPNLKLRLLIDNNGSSARAIPLVNVFKALRSGWKTIDIDGHSINQLINAFQENDSNENLVIICDTKKGYPLKNMINNPIWHHRTPTSEEALSFNNEISLYFNEADK